jgi:hypothetical protein
MLLVRSPIVLFKCAKVFYNWNEFFKMINTNFLIIIFSLGIVADTHAQQDRLLTQMEVIEMGAQMTANCKSRYLRTTKKLSIVQIESVCTCISIRTLKRMTVRDILEDSRINGDVMVDSNTNLRKAINYFGPICTEEMIKKFNLN